MAVVIPEHSAAFDRILRESTGRASVRGESGRFEEPGSSEVDIANVTNVSVTVPYVQWVDLSAADRDDEDEVAKRILEPSQAVHHAEPALPDRHRDAPQTPSRQRTTPLPSLRATRARAAARAAEAPGAMSFTPTVEPETPALSPSCWRPRTWDFKPCSGSHDDQRKSYTINASNFFCWYPCTWDLKPRLGSQDDQRNGYTIDVVNRRRQLQRFVERCEQM